MPTPAMAMTYTVAKSPKETLTPEEALVQHKKYGCVSFPILEELLHVEIKKPYPFCDVCPFFKTKHTSVTKGGEHRDYAVGLLWGSDLQGPWPVPSIGGNKYTMLYIDHNTRVRFVHFVKSKNATAEVLPAFIQDARRLHMNIGPGAAMFTMHCDNGKGEFRSAAFTAALTLQNGLMTTCPPDTPQKNGMAERVWLELVPMAKCLLANVPGDCPPNFWSYAVKFACMILNRIPSAKLHNKSSYELVEELTGKNIAISHLELHRFGAAAHIVLPKATRDPTTGEVATYAVYLGVSEVNLAALFWRPDTGRISESIHFKLSGEYTNIFVTDPQGDSKLHRYKKPLKSGHKSVPAVTGFGSFPLIPELANPICISEDIATNSEFFDAESGNAEEASDKKLI